VKVRWESTSKLAILSLAGSCIHAILESELVFKDTGARDGFRFRVAGTGILEVGSRKSAAFSDH